MALKVLNGAKPDQTGAAVASIVRTAVSTLASVSITTTTVDSRVYGVSADGYRISAFTPNSQTTEIDDWANTTDGTEQVEWKATNATTTPGATTLGGSWATADKTCVAAFEVLPAIPASGANFMPFFR